MVGRLQKLIIIDNKNREKTDTKIEHLFINTALMKCPNLEEMIVENSEITLTDFKLLHKLKKLSIKSSKFYLLSNKS